jgi:outer membrane protein assembly factor BamD (BamD/ComL family)
VPARDSASAFAPAGPLASIGSQPPAPSATAAATPSSLDAEIELLRDARSALHAGDPSRALTLLDSHDRLYPTGALAEDAAAQRIYALCALGRTGEARTLVPRFLAAFPASPHAASVRGSCGAL